MKKYHNIRNVTIENGILELVVDGKKIRKYLNDLSHTFTDASPESISCFEITPSGYGIHWPILDEDISIDALLGVKNKPKFLKQKNNNKSLQRTA